MDISEIIKHKRELRKKLIDLVSEFEKETGVCVGSVLIKHESEYAYEMPKLKDPLIAHVQIDLGD